MYDQELFDEMLILAIIYIDNSKLMVLQIIDKMFKNKINRKILNTYKQLFKEQKRIELGELLSYFTSNEEINYLSELITFDKFDEVQIDSEFINAQKRILKRYKIDVIQELNNKLRDKKITMEEFTDKVNKVNAYKIDSNDYLITSKKMENEIYSSKKRIKFNRFKKIEEFLKLSENDFLIIGAGTGVGKSAILLNLMEDLSNNYQCIYFNLEMAESVLLRRLIGIFGNVPMAAIDKPETEYQLDVVRKAEKEIEKRKLYLISAKNTIQDIKVEIVQNKSDDKHTVVFIDHIGLIKLLGKKSIYEKTTEIAQELRQVSLALGCTIICASQLNRNSYNEEVPTLNMLKDSGEVENSSRKILLLYRNPDDKKKNKDTLEPIMNLQIVKNDDGIYKTIKLKYEKIKQRMEEENNYE